MLVGDSSSGLIYERGLNKGWLEAIKCAQTLTRINVVQLPIRLAHWPEEAVLPLAEYSQYCIELYENERDKALAKHNKIMLINKSTATTGIILTSGLGVVLSKWIGSIAKGS